MNGDTGNAARLITDASARVLRERDPDWLQRVRELETATSPGSLDPPTAMLIQIAVHASVTGLSEGHLRHFVTRALVEGVRYEEIVAAFKLCTILGIHAAAQATPILSDCLSRSGQGMEANVGSTPTLNAMREAGSVNDAWTALEQWDPLWLDRMLNVGLGREIIETLGKKTFELLCIAIDVSVTHIYNPGTRRHIVAALDIGVSPREILDVIKLVSVQSVRSMDVGIQILEEVHIELSNTM